MKLITFNYGHRADLRQVSGLVELSLVEESEDLGPVQRLFYSVRF